MSTPNTTEAAKAELIIRITSFLQLRLVDEIPRGAPERVDVVAVGKYIEELDGIIVTVHSDHPLGVGQSRVNANIEGVESTSLLKGWNLPPESLGGSKWERWPGTVQVRMLKDVDQLTGLKIIEHVCARIGIVINGEVIVPIRDEYGYTIFHLTTVGTIGYASGGGDISVNTRWVDFAALVSSSRLRS